MPVLVKNLKYNRSVVFDKGKFDKWCVFLVEANGLRRAPLDTDYFDDLRRFSSLYPVEKLFGDFESIYNKTKYFVDTTVLSLIEEIVLSYERHHQPKIEEIYTILYAGMIAEENKRFAVLKKRIKKLGVHQILKEKISVQEAANFSKGKSWEELNEIMIERGF